MSSTLKPEGVIQAFKDKQWVWGIILISAGEVSGGYQKISFQNEKERYMTIEMEGAKAIGYISEYLEDLHLPYVGKPHTENEIPTDYESTINIINQLEKVTNSI